MLDVGAGTGKLTRESTTTPATMMAEMTREVFAILNEAGRPLEITCRTDLVIRHRL